MMFVDIIMLHVDILYRPSIGQKYAIIVLLSSDDDAQVKFKEQNGTAQDILF